MSRRSFFVWAALPALLFAATPALSQAVVEQARTARLAGRVDESERMLLQFLRTNPNHYRALYNLGLVYEARAARTPPGPARAAHYRTAIRHMERALAVRSQGETDYTIYNSLGVMYMSLPDSVAAERYFLIGLKNEARLEPASRARLYNNLGYLYAVRGDTKKAGEFLDRSARLGSAKGDANLKRLKQAGVVR